MRCGFFVLRGALITSTVLNLPVPPPLAWKHGRFQRKNQPGTLALDDKSVIEASSSCHSFVLKWSRLAIVDRVNALDKQQFNCPALPGSAKSMM
jgi:hypothetical protein